MSVKCFVRSSVLPVTNLRNFAVKNVSCYCTPCSLWHIMQAPCCSAMLVEVRQLILQLYCEYRWYVCLCCLQLRSTQFYDSLLRRRPYEAFAACLNVSFHTTAIFTAWLFLVIANAELLVILDLSQGVNVGITSWMCQDIGLWDGCAVCSADFSNFIVTSDEEFMYMRCGTHSALASHSTGFLRADSWHMREKEWVLRKGDEKREGREKDGSLVIVWFF